MHLNKPFILLPERQGEQDRDWRSLPGPGGSGKEQPRSGIRGERGAAKPGPLGSAAGPSGPRRRGRTATLNGRLQQSCRASREYCNHELARPLLHVLQRPAGLLGQARAAGERSDGARGRAIASFVLVTLAPGQGKLSAGPRRRVVRAVLTCVSPSACMCGSCSFSGIDTAPMASALKVRGGPRKPGP